jgi:TonB family protein
MARYPLLLIALSALVIAGFAAAQTKQAPTVRTPRVVAPEEMQWGSYKQATPAGAKVALLYGNPENVAGGPFVLRVKAADGSSAGPQWHTVDLHLTVIQGGVLFAEGTAFDEKRARTVATGGYVQIPRGVRYTVVARGETTYQLQGNAPLKTYLVRSAPPVAVAAAPTDEQKQKAEFDAAVAAYSRASQAGDQGSLFGPVRAQFERIARGGGHYAAPAQDYLNTRFPAPPAPVGQSGSCPAIPTLQDRGWIVQEPKAGDFVATGLLDQKLTWISCPSPSFPARTATTARPGTIKLAVTLDERGSVVGVKLRGGISPPGFYEAATNAVRQWKTNPPRAKGVPVRTEVSLDIPFSP